MEIKTQILKSAVKHILKVIFLFFRRWSSKAGQRATHTHTYTHAHTRELYELKV